MKRSLDIELQKIVRGINDQAGLNEYIKHSHKYKYYNSFLDYFSSLGKVVSINVATLYKESGIERSYCYHLMNGMKIPGRDKIIRLCITAGLNLNETQIALEAGKVPLLSATDNRDIVIAYAVEKSFNVQNTNTLLASLNQSILE